MDLGGQGWVDGIRANPELESRTRQGELGHSEVM
jgi:hypothetical protein